MANTPATRTQTRARRAESDLVIVEQEDERFVASIFGEEFTFSTDVNPWLLLMLAEGGNVAQALTKLIYSLIEVDIPEGTSEDEAENLRKAEGDRFSDLMGSQRGLSMERLFKLVNDLIAAAGNGTATSSGD